MVEKSEFSGDVGQAVIGNVNEAPRLHNVVNLNMGADKTEELITDFQRERIATLAKELASINDEHVLSVYKIILTEFGIDKIRQLPKSKYKDAVSMLDVWISEARGPLRTSPGAELDISTPGQRHFASCSACAEKSASLSKLQRTSLLQWIVLAATASLCGWLLHQAPSAAAAGNQVTHDTNCYNDGKPYSIGSTAKILNIGVRECVAGMDDGVPRWGDIRRSRTH